jgi:hypothetical protein
VRLVVDEPNASNVFERSGAREKALGIEQSRR